MRKLIRSSIAKVRQTIHALHDRAGYELRIGLRKSTILVPITTMAGLGFGLPVLLDATVAQGTAVAVIVGLLNLPKLPDILVNGLKEAFEERAIHNQIETSIDKHAKFLASLEEAASTKGSALWRPDTERDEDGRRPEADRRVVWQAIELFASVIRERLRLHKSKDLRISLRVWMHSQADAETFYDSVNSRAGSAKSRDLHDELFGSSLEDGPAIRGRTYKHVAWANLRSSRHPFVQTANTQGDAFPSALLIDVALPSSSVHAAILIESRRRYEFGKRSRNEKIVESIVPFFLLARLALRHRTEPSPTLGTSATAGIKHAAADNRQVAS